MSLDDLKVLRSFSDPFKHKRTKGQSLAPIIEEIIEPPFKDMFKAIGENYFYIEILRDHLGTSNKDKQ